MEQAPLNVFQQAVSVPFALGALPGAVVSMDFLEGRLYEVWCSHPGPSSQAATLRSLRRKLREAQAHDSEDEDASTLGGNGLTGDSVGAVTVCRDEWEEVVETGGEQAKMAELSYRLVAARGRSALGYVTFDVRISDGNELHDEPAVEVAVIEVWVQPAHRGLGVGALMAQAVATLTIHAITTLDDRLHSVGCEPISVGLDVIADVYSSSGERFLHVVAQALEEDPRLADTLRCVDIAEVGVDARW